MIASTGIGGVDNGISGSIGPAPIVAGPRVKKANISAGGGSRGGRGGGVKVKNVSPTVSRPAGLKVGRGFPHFRAPRTLGGIRGLRGTKGLVGRVGGKFSR
jgi:hypothetical protein